MGILHSHNRKEDVYSYLFQHQMKKSSYYVVFLSQWMYLPTLVWGLFLHHRRRFFAIQDLSQDRRWSTRLISYISIAIAFLFLVLRFWARFQRSFGYGLDDW